MPGGQGSEVLSGNNQARPTWVAKLFRVPVLGGYGEDASPQGLRLLAVLSMVSIIALTTGGLLAPTSAFLTLALVLWTMVFLTFGRVRVEWFDALVVTFILSLGLGEALIDPSVNDFAELVRWLSLAAIARALTVMFPLRLIACAFLAFGVGLVAVLTLDAVTGSGGGSFDSWQVVTGLLHKNDAAAVVGIAVLSGVWLLLREVRSLRLPTSAMLGILLLVLSLFLVLLESLAALGATAIGLVSLLLAQWAAKLSPAWRASWGVGFFFFPVLSITVAQVTGVFALLGKRSDFFGRFDIWSYTVQDWGTVWLWGSPGSYWTPERGEELAAQTGSVVQMTISDNSFLDVFLNQGVFALALLIAVIAAAVGGVIHKAQSPESNSFFGEIVLILILTISFFNSTLLSPLFFLMSMLMLFGSRITARVPRSNSGVEFRDKLGKD